MTISRSDSDPRGTRPGGAEVVVVGAGPAGLSAAVAAGEAGARVTLVDAETAVGGQFWRHPAPAPGSGDGAVDEAEVAPLHHDLRTYRRLRRRWRSLLASGRATYAPLHEVWAVESLTGPSPGGSRAADRPSGAPRFAVHAVTGSPNDRHEVTIEAVSLVLATGAYDLPLPFPGWDLPGVMTPGGVQSLLKGHAVVAGRRVVVAGTGPFLLSVASGLATMGATVLGVYESASPAAWLRSPRNVLAAMGQGGKVLEGAGYAAGLARHGVGYHPGWTVLRADAAATSADADADALSADAPAALAGATRLGRVTVAPLDAGGIPQPDRARTLEADLLAVGWGFVPRLELPLALGCGTRVDASGLPVVTVDGRQRTTVSGVYVAGEACGVGGAALAAVEGEIAGIAAAGRLGTEVAAPQLANQMVTRRLVHLARRRASLRTFADTLARVYPIPQRWAGALPDDTVVCRCEEVTAGAIREAARRDGARDARTAKLLVRPGMGWCQGRICGYATDCLVAQVAGRTPRHRPVEQPVATPVPLGVLAAGAPPSAARQ